MASIEIRPLAELEIELLEHHLGYGTPGKHRDRFAAQQRGEGMYLIAREKALPLGHLMLWWRAPASDPIASKLRDCPHVEDVLVDPERRSQGTGTLLLDRAEALAVERGCARIGLAVGIDNPRAHALYLRRGYAGAGFGEFRIGGSFTDRDGQGHSWHEDCVYLIKRLREQTAQI